MEVVEEGEGFTRPTKRKEEGRRDPSRFSATTISIVLAVIGRAPRAFFLSTINKQADALLGHALAAICPSDYAHCTQRHKAATVRLCDAAVNALELCCHGRHPQSEWLSHQS